MKQFGKAYGKIEFGFKEAQTGGEVLGELLLNGTPGGLVDSMIAGFAIENDEKILTRNPEDFERIPGIKVETY